MVIYTLLYTGVWKHPGPWHHHALAHPFRALLGTAQGIGSRRQGPGSTRHRREVGGKEHVKTCSLQTLRLTAPRTARLRRGVMTIIMVMMTIMIIMIMMIIMINMMIMIIMMILMIFFIIIILITIIMIIILIKKTS